MRWVIMAVIILTVVNLGILTWQLLPGDPVGTGQKASPVPVQPQFREPVYQEPIPRGPYSELGRQQDLERRLECLEFKARGIHVTPGMMCH